LGKVYLLSGEEDKAVSMFDRAMQLEPGSSVKNSVAYELAIVNKRLEAALRYAQDAVREEEEASLQVRLSAVSDLDLQHTSRLSAYWDTLGWVHYRLGNLKQAEGYLFAAWLIQPAPAIGYHLGQVYEKSQRRQDAAHIYRIVADQQTREPENAQAVADAKLRLGQLGTAPALSGRPLSSRNRAADELGENRTVWLPKLVPEHASAELFLLFAPGPKVEETKFISGSDKLQSAGKALERVHFKVAFPENSSARLVRRGILACYPITGCSFVLLPVEATRAVE
jgi:tetratricopeptide (TPR) repeat protein